MRFVISVIIDEDEIFVIYTMIFQFTREYNIETHIIYFIIRGTIFRQYI